MPEEMPSDDLEAVFVDGFNGYVPTQQDLSFLLTDPDMKRRKHDVGVFTGGLPGPIPQTEEEMHAVVGALIMTKARRKLGHNVDLDKVTWQTADDLLVVKVWK